MRLEIASIDPTKEKILPISLLETVVDIKDLHVTGPKDFNRKTADMKYICNVVSANVFDRFSRSLQMIAMKINVKSEKFISFYRTVTPMKFPTIANIIIEE